VTGEEAFLILLVRFPFKCVNNHQTAIIIRYITQNPILEGGKELKGIIHKLRNSDKWTFEAFLHNWHDKWDSFLLEKSYNPVTGKWHNTHRRIRSAFAALKLFTASVYLF